MPYEIRITEITFPIETRREWKQVQSYELAKDRNEREYGNVEVTGPVKHERVVLLQNIDTLDLKAVIMAVNGLTGGNR